MLTILLIHSKSVVPKDSTPPGHFCTAVSVGFVGGHVIPQTSSSSGHAKGIQLTMLTRTSWNV